MKRAVDYMPEGFEIIRKGRFWGGDVVEFRNRCNWGTDTNVARWQRIIDNSLASLAVLNTEGEIVGTGFLAGNERHAILCDLLVRPDQRGNGIGKALITSRIQTAEDLFIPYLYTELAATNTLKRFYEELGFESNGHQFVRASRRHPDEL